MKKLLLLVLFSMTVLAQQPLKVSFNHLDQEGGLSNTNVFTMHRDSRGFMWLGTLNGLTRFDGINCKIYKPNNSGIRGVGVKSITEDRVGNLWIGTEAGLNFYNRKTDTFTFVLLGKENYTAVPFRVDDRQLVWLTVMHPQHKGTYTYDGGNRKWVRRSHFTGPNVHLDLKAANTAMTRQYLPGPNDIGIQKVSYANYKVSKTEVFLNGTNNLPSFTHIAEYIYEENDSTLWITGNPKGLLKLNTLKHTFKIFARDNNIFTHVVPYQHYLIMGSNNGLFVFNKLLGQFVQQIQYANSNVFGPGSNWSENLHLDAEGNFFLSNLGPGVDFTNLNRIIAETWLDPEASGKLGYNDNKIQHIVLGKNELYGKYQNGPVMVLDFNGNFKRKYAHYEVFMSDSQNRQWLFNGKNIECYSPDTGKMKAYYFKEFDGRKGWELQMEEIGLNKYLLAGPNGIFEFDEKTEKLTALDEFNKVGKFRIKPMYYDQNTQQVFVMSSWWTDFYALKKINNTWQITKTLKSVNAYAIRPSVSKGWVWLCTRNGLLKLNTANFETQVSSEKNGLPDNFVTDIIEETNENYYIVTGKGIAYYDKKTARYQQFTSKDGIYAKEIDWNCAFKLPDGRAVFGGTNGIHLIDKNVLKTYPVKPRIQITDLIINEKIVNTKPQIGEVKNLKLNANQNSFGFKLVGIAYGFPKKIKLQYQMEGLDKQWISTENGTVARYNNVPEGNYIFKVKTVDEDKPSLNTGEKTIQIQVAAPFYRTAWFRGLLLSGFVLLGYILYRLRTTQIRKDARKKEEIRRIRAEAEVNSLRSQMNPHFIFNSLNTVDSFILRNKTDEASEYLNKFSRLIRMILENSREDYIPLTQDLEALELYINLEQERSHPAFTYMIETDAELKSNTYLIPATLIQPFVENAIIHGFKNKKTGEGKLTITVEKADNLIQICIDDNGVGMAATQGKSKNKKSLGTQVTRERIEKLNQLYPNMASINIIDKIDADNFGTRVYLSLPLITETS